MSFLRHGEIYRSDVTLNQSWERQPASSPPVLIGYDEFPAGYSLAGCPPAEPASASPTKDDSQQPSPPYNDFSANSNNPLNFVSQSTGALQNGSTPPFGVQGDQGVRSGRAARGEPGVSGVLVGVGACFAPKNSVTDTIASNALPLRSKSLTPI
jgi:hypothetical protein